MKVPLIAALLMLTTHMALSETPGEKLNRQGNDLARDGKLEEAIVLYSRAIEAEPDYEEPFYNRGKAKLNLKDLKGALADFDAALKLNPKYADALNNRGITKKKLGDITGAIEDYTNALKYDPGLYRVYYNRGVARYEAGDPVAAMQDFTVAADHNVPEAMDAVQKMRAGGR